MFTAIDVPHDNSCLFHAVGYFVKEPGASVRSLACKKLYDYKDIVIQDLSLQAWVEASEGPLEPYIAKMQQRDSWGGFLELVVLALAYKRQIIVYSNQTVSGPAKKVTQIGTTGDPIFLLYVQNNHYMVLAKQK